MLGFQFNVLANWLSEEFGDACLDQVIQAWRGKRVELAGHSAQPLQLPMNSSCPYADGLMQRYGHQGMRRHAWLCDGTLV